MPLFETVVEERDCVRADLSIMKVRISRPMAPGPFPAVIDIHGGGWVSGDRNQNAVIDDAMAACGIISIAPEFRMPPATQYPTPVTDVHLAIRWMKANAASLGARTDRFGGIGTSSGAHQLLEVALRPSHPAYASESASDLSNFDAALDYVVACWPVADPLRRFHFAQEREIGHLLSAHQDYWPDENAMASGNPQAVVEKRQFEVLPPLLVLQGTKDDNLPADMAQRFVTAYRTAGGDARLEEFPDQPHTFLTRHPTSPASQRALTVIADFVLQQAA